MTANKRTGKRGLLGELSRKAAETVATIRYGTPLAISARWRESMAAEAAARSRHQRTSGYTAERARIVHQALRGVGQ